MVNKTKPRIRLKFGVKTGNVREIKPPEPNQNLVEELEDMLADAKSGRLVAAVIVGMDAKGDGLWNAYSCPNNIDHQKLNYYLNKTCFEHTIWAMLRDSRDNGCSNALVDYFVTRYELFG